MYRDDGIVRRGSYPVKTAQVKSRLKFCKMCHHGGLVWYHTDKGRWLLCEPYPNTETPDPSHVHGCFIYSKGMTPGPRMTRSYKPSEYRLKKRRR